MAIEQLLDVYDLGDRATRAIPFGGALMINTTAEHPSLGSLTHTTCPKNTSKATLDGKGFDTSQDHESEADAIYD